MAFVGRNCLPIVELQMGTARAGVVLTILNWRLHPQELAYVLADSARAMPPARYCAESFANPIGPGASGASADLTGAELN